MRLPLALLLAAVGAAAAGPTAELARQIAEAGLDPDACYHVRDLKFTRGDIRIYFNEGYLIFGRPVGDTRLTAVFSAEGEGGGDGEVLILPPTRSERLSLASYTKSPNLNEHFKSAVLLFTDDTFYDLDVRLRERGDPRKSPENGVLLAEKWAPVVKSFVQSFQVRVVKDLLSDSSENGLFYAAISGDKLGNFDVIFDPRATEQITVGQVTYRDQRAYFDTWTRFASRAFRQGRRTVPAPDVIVLDYRIEATLDPSLNMQVITRATIVPGADGRRALSFDISSQMRISGATLDGEPAEVFQPESMRARLIRGGSNEMFLLVPAKPLVPGHEHTAEFWHEGNVITSAGNRVYFVGARGAWYPNRNSQFSRYDLTFRHPKELDLVATGRLADQRTEGETKISHYRSDGPVRMAGFNLGDYEHEKLERDGYTIDVYANRKIETALAPKPDRIVLVPRPQPGPAQQPRWTVDLQPAPLADFPRPTERLALLAAEIAGALQFMAGQFGPPVLRHLTVAPIPGGFGQGFPGLIYLSTLAYLEPSQRPAALRNEYQRTFYSEILHAHETAHQWWGNLVTSSNPEDDWMMEALANYSALMYLEKRKDPRALESVLAEYRNHLLAKNQDGETIESAGPIIWGGRLYSSHTPEAWRIITYEKGSWIIHMLRRRIGDPRFSEMLAQMRKRYQYKGIATDEFRRLCAEFLPPRSPDPQLEGFFEQFVNSTGVPSIKLNHSVRGAGQQWRVSGTVTQSDVDEDFSTFVPVEIQFAKGKPLVQWVRTSTEGTPFAVTVRQQPVRVLLDPNGSLLKK